MNKFISVLFLFLSSLVGFSQSDTLQLQVENKIKELSGKYGELPKAEKSYFTDLIVATKLSKEGDYKIDYNQQHEEYLKKIFLNIQPNATETPSLSLYKSPFPNAFTNFVGDIRFHWGLLAELDNEASLAFLMGHEYAHYEKSHLYQSYVSRYIDTESDRESVIKHYHNSQKHEYESDSLGFVYGVNAGYKWESGLSDFNEFISLDTVLALMQEQYKRIYDATGDVVEFETEEEDTVYVSHPPTETRMKKWRSWGNQHNQSGQDFLVSEAGFNALKNYAKEMTLKQYLKSQNYKLGLIKAFKYYSLDPENPLYHYYLYEFLRRKIAVNGELLDEPFLGDIFISANGRGVYENLGWLYKKGDQIKNVRNNVLPEILQFGNTYANLIEYLEQQKQISFHQEYYLSKAIKYQKDDSLKNVLILKYLSYENSLYPDYAKALRDNSLAFTLKTQSTSLIFINSLNRFYKNDQGYGTDPKISVNRYKKLVPKIDKKLNKELDGDIKILYRGQSDFDFEEFNTVVQGFINAKNSRVNYGENKQGVFINGSSNLLQYPEVWTYFFDNKIGEINIINIYDRHDQSVSYGQNFLTKFSFNLRGIHGVFSFFPADARKVRRKYSITMDTLEGGDCITNQKTVLSYTRLTDNLVLTEILLLLQ